MWVVRCKGVVIYMRFFDYIDTIEKPTIDNIRVIYKAVNEKYDDLIDMALEPNSKNYKKWVQNMEKKDLKHLSRSELVDVICEMKKDTTNSNDLTMEEIESEQKRLKDRAVYRKTLKGTIGILVVVAAISVLVATLWMPVLSIYGYSMSPTLEQGQYVVSVKNKDLKSGDIVAFWQGNKLLVKRVIASPGQWVDIDVNGNVSVDGKVLDEKYLNEKALGNCDIDLPHQVSESHWFLMGDNRDTSIDSRSRAIGDISKEQIEGQIIFRIWPFDQIGSVK